MNNKTFRENLFKEMKNLQSGKTTNAQARNIAKLAGQVVYSRRLDIESKKLNLDIMKATKSACFNNASIEPIDM